MININSLFEKEIISIIDGSKIGEIYDVEIDEISGKILNITVLKRMWLFARREKNIIPWDCVKVIGEETILVEIIKNEFKLNRKGNLIKSFLD